MSSKKELVRVERLGSRATIVLDDPDRRNAMSEEMGVAFSRVVSGLLGDRSLRVIVLTGAGKAFSGGGDLEMLEAKTRISREENEKLMMSFYGHFLSLRVLEIPVIAAINGHAVGAGLCLALACDMRFAVPEAKLGLNFVHLGLHPGMGATYSVPRLLGDARAAELLYTGAIVSAEEGERVGLVNRVFPAADFETQVQNRCEQISSAGPQAVRSLKQTLRQLQGATLQECLLREANCQAGDYVGPEFAEGILAAKEKRKPKFPGV